jgi:hypothetical protein
MLIYLLKIYKIISNYKHNLKIMYRIINNKAKSILLSKMLIKIIILYQIITKVKIYFKVINKI